MIATIVLIVLQLCSVLSTLASAEEEGATKWQSHFPDDAELATPEFLCDYEENIRLMTAVPESQIVTYDSLTGEETILGIQAQDTLPEEWIPGMEEDDPGSTEGQFGLMNFSGLTLVGNPEDWPWKPNCKIYYTRNGARWMASGVLIDAYHVLCAGHSIHEGNGGDWSTDIVVVPAYHEGKRPYGDAQDVRLFSWVGWTQSGDLDHDIGLIRLDRPIGALTGWLGYGWTSDKSFYTQAGFDNPGYPADAPYTGQYMYDWAGTFDYLTSSSYPRAVICRRGVSGQAGSGAYTKICGLRYVFAVFSSLGTGTYYNRTYFPIITETKFNQIKCWIDQITPSCFDLLALDVEVSPQTIRAGERFDSMSYLVYNHSSASCSGTFYVDVYLSTNDNITTSDIKIDRHSFTASIDPKGKVRITVSDLPAIPSGVASGNYWIGVILDVPDNDTSNNKSDGQEAAPIQVTTDSGGGCNCGNEDCINFNPWNTQVVRIGGRWKIVEGNMWMLDFGSNEAEAREALRIIRYYGMNSQCFVGRPNPSMTYWLVNGSAPVGSMPGEDSVGFNPWNIEVRWIGGRWKIVEGNHWILDFGSREDEARQALCIIQKYGFTRICFVGRPNASMTYFRK